MLKAISVRLNIWTPFSYLWNFLSYETQPNVKMPDTFPATFIAETAHDLGSSSQMLPYQTSKQKLLHGEDTVCAIDNDSHGSSHLIAWGKGDSGSEASQVSIQWDVSCGVCVRSNRPVSTGPVLLWLLDESSQGLVTDPQGL